MWRRTTRHTSQPRACRRRDYVRRITRSSPFLTAAIFQQSRSLRDQFLKQEEESAHALGCRRPCDFPPSFPMLSRTLDVSQLTVTPLISLLHATRILWHLSENPPRYLNERESSVCFLPTRAKGSLITPKLSSLTNPVGLRCSNKAHIDSR